MIQLYKWRLPALLLVITLLIGSRVEASHFRGGTLTWQQAGGRNIQINVNTSFRRGYPWSGGSWSGANPPVGATIVIGTIFYGDGGSANMIATVTSSDATNDVISTSYTVTHTYANDGNYVVNALYSCCRLTSVADNNHDANFNLQTVVNVGAPYNNSPVSSFPVKINVPINVSNVTYTVPGSDPDGDAVTFRMAKTGQPINTTTDQNSESGLNVQSPPGFSLSSSGVITMNTTSGVSVGNLFVTQVMMEDRTSANVVKSKVPIDFLITVVAASQAPAFISPTPLAPNNVYSVTPGTTVNFSIAANDADPARTVTLNPVSVPVGATMSPALPVTGAVNGTASSSFSWTPTSSQTGTYVITFVATSDLGMQTFFTVTINVLCALNATTSITPSLCASLSNGAVSVTPSNYSSTANLIYSWTGPGSFSASSQNISNIRGGNYNLRIDDNGTGCFKTLSVAVPNTTTLGFSATTAAPTCPNATNGSIVMASPAGTAPFQYSNDGGSSYQGSGSFTGLASGNYPLKMTDANGCALSQNVTVNAGVDNTPPTITAPADVTVNGWCTSVPAAQVNLGTPAVADNCGTSNVSNNAPASFPVGTTTVLWTVNDGNGNSAQATQTVTVNSGSLSAGMSVTNSLNNNAYPLQGQELNSIYLNWTAANGAITPSAQSEDLVVTPTGGTAPYSFAWQQSNCNGNTMGAIGSSITVVNSSVSPYKSIATWTPTIADICLNNGNNDNLYYMSCVVTDAHGCSTAPLSKRVNVVNPWTTAPSTTGLVQVCHKVAVRGGSVNQLLSVTPSQVATHLAHGDQFANCTLFNGVRSQAPEEIMDEQKVAVYPNPTTGAVTLEISEVREGASVLITDITGKAVVTEFITKNQVPTLTLDLSNLSKGLYLVEVRDGSFSYRTKLVVQ